MINKTTINSIDFSSLFTGNYEEDMKIFGSLLLMGVKSIDIYPFLALNIIKSEYFPILKIIVEQNDISTLDNNLLLRSISNYNVKAVQLLLEHKFPPETEGLLERAVLKDQPEIVDLLLTYGSDNMFHRTNAAVYAACNHQTTKVLDVLVKHGLDLQEFLIPILEHKAYNRLHLLEYLYNKGLNCNQDFFISNILINDYLPTMQFLVRNYNIDINLLVSKINLQAKIPVQINEWAIKYKTVTNFHQQLNNQLTVKKDIKNTYHKKQKI